MIKTFFVFLIFLAISSNFSHGEFGVSGNTRKASFRFENAPEKQRAEYKVIGIKDGDTFVLLMDGKEQVIRLAHIDCPEKNQPYGNKAKQFAAAMCFGKYVTLIHNNTYDRNRRLIAEVILPGAVNLNKEIVKNGLAWHFKKYSRDAGYAELENNARKRKAGLWSEPHPIAPWNWRNHKHIDA